MKFKYGETVAIKDGFFDGLKAMVLDYFDEHDEVEYSVYVLTSENECIGDRRWIKESKLRKIKNDKS